MHLNIPHSTQPARPSILLAPFPRLTSVYVHEGTRGHSSLELGITWKCHKLPGITQKLAPLHQRLHQPVRSRRTRFWSLFGPCAGPPRQTEVGPRINTSLIIHDPLPSLP